MPHWLTLTLYIVHTGLSPLPYTGHLVLFIGLREWNVLLLRLDLISAFHHKNSLSNWLCLYIFLIYSVFFFFKTNSGVISRSGQGQVDTLFWLLYPLKVIQSLQSCSAQQMIVFTKYHQLHTSLILTFLLNVSSSLKPYVFGFFCFFYCVIILKIKARMKTLCQTIIVC